MQYHIVVNKDAKPEKVEKALFGLKLPEGTFKYLKIFGVVLIDDTHTEKLKKIQNLNWVKGIYSEQTKEMVAF